MVADGALGTTPARQRVYRRYFGGGLPLVSDGGVAVPVWSAGGVAGAVASGVVLGGADAGGVVSLGAGAVAVVSAGAGAADCCLAQPPAASIIPVRHRKRTLRFMDITS